MIKALAPALPEAVVAGQPADPMNITIVGRRADGTRWVTGDATAVGWGAHAGGDGCDGLINYGAGDLKNYPIEVIESRYPLRVHRYGLREGSGGAGRYRGGLGIVREYELLEDGIEVSLWLERSKLPAWGLFGGEDGVPTTGEVERDGVVETVTKANAMRLPRGSRVRVMTGGGGGYGPAGRAIARGGGRRRGRRLRVTETWEAGEAIVAALAAGGVERLFFTSGSDILALQEAVAKRAALGLPTPKLVTMLHEAPALNAALGYSMVSGRPSALAVHVDVGLLNAGAALHTARRNGHPIVLLAGSPATAAHGTMRGALDHPIFWLQEPRDLRETMRGYVKWSWRLQLQDDPVAVDRAGTAGRRRRRRPGRCS